MSHERSIFVTNIVIDDDTVVPAVEAVVLVPAWP
jgi:hypothetical protein